jgi:Uncharacterised protein family UPF0547
VAEDGDEESSVKSQTSGSQEGEKTCPRCGERVPQVARVCRYCQYRFDRRGWLRDHPLVSTAVAALITATIGVLVSNLLGTGASGEDAASHVNDCIQQHGMTKPQEETIDQISGGVFRSCTWPPIPGAQPDGYTEVVLTSLRGPGESEATGATWVDRISVPSGCHEIQLHYSFSTQGGFRRERPIVVPVGDLLTVTGESWEPGPESPLPFDPAESDVVVVRSSKHFLDLAECVG